MPSIFFFSVVVNKWINRLTQYLQDVKNITPVEVSWGHRVKVKVKSQSSQCSYCLKVLNPRNMHHTKYEQCTLYR